jgi:NADH dehydrogenase
MQQPLTFAVIGGGPTGVELAGAIADLARLALAKDFKAIDTTKARVRLFEGASNFAKDEQSPLERTQPGCHCGRRIE